MKMKKGNFFPEIKTLIKTLTDWNFQGWNVSVLFRLRSMCLSSVTCWSEKTNSWLCLWSKITWSQLILNWSGHMTRGVEVGSSITEDVMVSSNCPQTPLELKHSEMTPQHVCCFKIYVKFTKKQEGKNMADAQLCWILFHFTLSNEE